MSRYYVLAPNELYPNPSLWRINEQRPDHDVEVMYRPPNTWPCTDDGRQWFDDVVAGLRATGLCEPTDREEP